MIDKTNSIVPQVTFKMRENYKWISKTTDNIFANKKIILFSLPGAYTPTCSSAHLPRYDELTAVFKENGIDDVICLAVNDTFVMNNWQKNQATYNITMLPDGNGEFSEKMGMLVTKDDLGFGKRAWRYSMLVENKVIKKMFIEPEQEGDPFLVSDADTMLNYINKSAKKPDNALIFTRDGCPFCKKSKELLSKHNIDFEEIKVGKDIRPRSIRAISGKNSVPQIFINGKYIGGSDDLEISLMD